MSTVERKARDEYYTWSDVRKNNWTWTSDEPVQKAWDVFAQLEVLVASSSLINFIDRLPEFGADLTIHETIAINEQFSQEWTAFVLAIETFGIVDDVDRSFVKKLYESFQILSEKDKALVKTFEQAIKVTSDVASIASFHLLFDEKLTVDEVISKTLSMSLGERIKILDELITGGGDTIVSDLRILSKALSDSEFEELLRQSSPAGYGPFVPFIAGDYEYQDALFKVVMRTRDLNRPYLTQVRLDVDLPDLFDQGELDVPAERTVIHFHKKFNPNEPPTITVVLKGGTGVVPDIDFDVLPGNQSFYVELTHPDTSVPLAGKIVWKAQGY